jgi:O-antigen chain-terminating methyltransferase
MIQGFDIDTLSAAVERLNQFWNIQIYGPIYSRSGIVGRFIIFIKRIIRKCISFYLVPIIVNQNTFNQAVLDAFIQLQLFIKTQAEQSGKKE